MNRDEYYNAVLNWCEEVAAQFARPVFIGINGPQGSGKTTLSSHLQDALKAKSLRCVAISIDDFYLTYAQQLELGQSHPQNPYLQQRGYPGTHDIELGSSTLNILRKLKDGESCQVPSYDKSAHAGNGDRKPQDQWRQIAGPVQVVLVEGWMLGFPTVADSELSDPAMREINWMLRDYHRWNALMDAWVVLSMADPSYVVQWRVEAEENMKRSGKAGMDEIAIRSYVAKFLPAYEVYSPAIAVVCQQWPRVLRFTLGADRLPR